MNALVFSLLATVTLQTIAATAALSQKVGFIAAAGMVAKTWGVILAGSALLAVGCFSLIVAGFMICSKDFRSELTQSCIKIKNALIHDLIKGYKDINAEYKVEDKIKNYAPYVVPVLSGAVIAPLYGKVRGAQAAVAASVLSLGFNWMKKP